MLNIVFVKIAENLKDVLLLKLTCSLLPEAMFEAKVEKEKSRIKKIS